MAYTFIEQCIMEEGRGRNLEAEPSTAHERPLLTGLLSLLLFTSQDYKARVGTTHMGLGPLTLIKKMPPHLPTGQSCGDIFSIEAPLPDDLSLCQFDKNQTNKKLTRKNPRPLTPQSGHMITVLLITKLVS